jgi:hypothetical protein
LSCGMDCVSVIASPTPVGGFSIVGGDGDEAGVSEDDRQGVGNDLFVVHDKDDRGIFHG